MSDREPSDIEPPTKHQGQEDVPRHSPKTDLGTDEVITDKSKVDFTKGGVDQYKFYPDVPENHRHKYRWTHKEASKFYDPCEESRQASLDCILRNAADRSVCQDFFDAYKECRKDFFSKKKKDKREGKGGWGIW